jgi:uncharacterized membrane protein YbhN (UPF0104 family)
MKRVLSWLGAAFAFAMFVVAVTVIRHQLRGHSFHQIVRALESVPMGHLLTAFGLTAVCYLCLTGYDLLAVRALSPRPKTGSIMLNSFICHALSINVGMSSLMGGSIRFHYYLRKGVSAGNIIRIVTFCIVTFWLGFLAVGGALFLFAPPPVPEFVHLPFPTLQPLGMLLLLVLLGYFLVILFWKKPLTIRGWTIPIIPMHVTLGQIVIAASEWILGAAVLWALLPPHYAPMFIHLLSFYFLAQVSGVVSQVPSGLGVFESIVIGFAPPHVDPSKVLASLLLYRLIFNLLPLSIAGALLLIREVRLRKSATLSPL